MHMSPPSRAAWIEISALTLGTDPEVSPPSRAAWIEMPMSPTTLFASVSSAPSRAAGLEMRLTAYCVHTEKVAAFTGGVD